MASKCGNKEHDEYIDLFGICPHCRWMELGKPYAAKLWAKPESPEIPVSTIWEEMYGLTN